MSKLIYTGGAYRASTENEIYENIQRARNMAIEVWKLGAYPICPHTNSAFMGGVVPDDVFLAGGLAILEKCDAMILVEPWHGSQGTIAEINHAHDCDIPVFESLLMLAAWLNEES